MRKNMIKKVLLYTAVVAAVLSFAACTSALDGARQVDQLPRIYPDYVGVTIPVGIAPMNFCYTGGPYSDLYVKVTGSKGGELVASGSEIDFDMEAWHQLTAHNRGGKLMFSLSVKRDGEWTTYRNFDMYVSPDELGAWGLTYRRIRPGYEVYGKMGIYQRCLSNFEETPIIENTIAPGACLNCHTANKTNPEVFTFHVRGANGATLIQTRGKREWLAARNDSIKGSMVYPYWHPSGKYCAYSTNQTHQSFHQVSDERIEVFDQSSDIFVYCPETHELLLDSILSTKDHYETYPVFSPDGKSLYFCSSRAWDIPANYQRIRYDICRISFNPATGKFGNRVDTLFRASSMGKSATHPRPSYDGKYIMFTMSDYGCFPIWHQEADNWLLDLRTGEARPLTAANSRWADSWHNWSSNSHWFVFTSRRGDGLYTRLYFATIDNQGNVSKPFLLPQRRPGKYYDELLDSFNTPDFTSAPVDFDTHAGGNEILSNKRVKTKVR